VEDLAMLVKAIEAIGYEESPSQSD
jgi:hypothetical protein